jgi:hypothetical protein
LEPTLIFLDRTKIERFFSPKLKKEYLMMNWFEPQDFKDWIQRGQSLRLILIVFAIVVITLTEFRYNWIEKSIGAYLLTTNDDRPESGAIWDLGHQTQTARKNIADIVSDNHMSQHEVQGAESFSQVLSGLKDDNGVSISASHFRKLYDELPTVLSQELLSPYSLLQSEAQGDWVRTYFTKDEKGIHIYLLNRQNQVLKEVVISGEIADYIIKGEVAISGPLSNFADFADHIYPADIFFNTLEAMSESGRRGVLPQPEMLLNTSGQLKYVGISNEQIGGMVAVGFEYEQNGAHKVILVQGQLKEVEKIRTRLSNWQGSNVTESDLEN